MSELDFIKMHGLGNDFVILDRRDGGNALSPAVMRAIADRRGGIGCDQLIVMEPAKADVADVFMRIYNPDGSEVGACGNATRCVASILMDEKNSDHAIVETTSGLLDSEKGPGGLYSVDMGPAKLDWRDIPVLDACDTLHLPLSVDGLSDPVGVNVGNPHAVFFVDDADAIDLATIGPVIENHKFFPERTNVEVVEILSPDRIRMRVWERGAGITRACGSGACAALVAAVRRGLSERAADVVLDGGILRIEWLADNNILMTGPISNSFKGELDPALLTDTNG
ncbi:MAG: diaminopimelate epimerase [Rhodospirillaceae bacterium]|nr:diaminopimelate epimerase [Rhodospirillaceae bacterium]